MVHDDVLKLLCENKFVHINLDNSTSIACSAADLLALICAVFMCSVYVFRYVLWKREKCQIYVGTKNKFHVPLAKKKMLKKKIACRSEWVMKWMHHLQCNNTQIVRNSNSSLYMRRFTVGNDYKVIFMIFIEDLTHSITELRKCCVNAVLRKCCFA